MKLLFLIFTCCLVCSCNGGDTELSSLKKEYKSLAKAFEQYKAQDKIRAQARIKSLLGIIEQTVQAQFSDVEHKTALVEQATITQHLNSVKKDIAKLKSNAMQHGDKRLKPEQQKKLKEKTTIMLALQLTLLKQKEATKAATEKLSKEKSKLQKMKSDLLETLKK